MFSPIRLLMGLPSSPKIGHHMPVSGAVRVKGDRAVDPCDLLPDTMVQFF